jgi:probable HAF family extracellular repeat protein
MISKRTKILMTLFLGLLTLLFGVTKVIAVQYTYAPIDVPNAVKSTAYAINNVGQIVGWYGDSSNCSHGYVLSGGSFTTIDYPGCPSPDYPGFYGGTNLFGINDSGEMVGDHGPSWYAVAFGFTYSGGIISPFPTQPGALSTKPIGINNAGQIVGASEMSYYPWPIIGFLYSGGNFTAINPPGAINPGAMGINDLGQIVGCYYEAPPGAYHGFLYVGGSFTDINYPGAKSTFAHRINNSGVIVGFYADSGDVQHGFRLDGNTFTSLDYPGATSTAALGINDSGQIVGYYSDSAGIPHAFIATPAALINVTIDIKPGSADNPINPKSNGKIPVAILSTLGFYAPDRVDLSSLTFGHTGNEASLAFCTIEDVNGDGVADVVGHFYTQATGFKAGDTQGILKGKTVDGIPISGSDAVRIVPGK